MGINKTATHKKDEGQDQRKLKLKMRTKDKAAFIGCIKAALAAIAEANIDYQALDREAAIKAYDDAYYHARRGGLRPGSIRMRCEGAYLKCLSRALSAILVAVVRGDMDMRETLVDWFEEDRRRMVDVGYKTHQVDAKFGAY